MQAESDVRAPDVGAVSPFARRWASRASLLRSCDGILGGLLILHVPLLVVIAVVQSTALPLAVLPLVCGLLPLLASPSSSPCNRARMAWVGLSAAAGMVLWVTGPLGAAHLAYALTVAGVALLATQPTRRRRLSELQHEVESQLEELDRLRTQTLAMLSHELRTPLTGVIGFARTLSSRLDDLDGATLRLIADSIDDHSRRLARVVDNLVVASREPISSETRRCDVGRSLSAAISGLGLPGEVKDRIRISLSGALHAEIGSNAAVQILSNLMDNAVKFSPPDSAVLVDGSLEASEVVIDVANVGPPISPELRADLYEPFVQADSTDARQAGGLGLGLHVVRRLVEAYGGRIDLVDDPDLIVFRVRLPSAPRTTWVRKPQLEHSAA